MYGDEWEVNAYNRKNKCAALGGPSPVLIKENYTAGATMALARVPLLSVIREEERKYSSFGNGQYRSASQQARHKRVRGFCQSSRVVVRDKKFGNPGSGVGIIIVSPSVSEGLTGPREIEKKLTHPRAFRIVHNFFWEKTGGYEVGQGAKIS